MDEVKIIPSSVVSVINVNKDIKQDDTNRDDRHKDSRDKETDRRRDRDSERSKSKRSREKSSHKDKKRDREHKSRRKDRHKDKDKEKDRERRSDRDKSSRKRSRCVQDMSSNIVLLIFSGARGGGQDGVNSPGLPRCILYMIRVQRFPVQHHSQLSTKVYKCLFSVMVGHIILCYQFKSGRCITVSIYAEVLNGPNTF